MTTHSNPELRQVLSEIRRPQPSCETRARQQLDSLTKPIGSLGRLEDLAAQIYSIFSGEIPSHMNRAVYIFAADHGVTAEGVSPYPAEVTAQMVQNFLNGGAAINVLARAHHASLTVIDIGVDADFGQQPGLCQRKVRRGSRNMRHEAAMTHEELHSALNAGMQLAHQAASQGVHLAAVGEMGIGNTTAASAITSLLLQQQATQVTGRGAGLDADGRNRKLHVIRRTLKLHFASTPNPPALEILRCVGGLEIAAMTGFYLKAAACRMAVVCDGFISTAAAAIAQALCPEVCHYLIAGHCSEEPGHRFLLRRLGLTPVLHLNMRLGEGTGAVLAMPIIESAAQLMTQMATFSSAGVSGALS